MKKFIFIGLLILVVCLKVYAQTSGKVDSLNHIINNNQNHPESRVIACVYLGEYYINKPGRNTKDIDSASASLKHGQQLNKVLNVHSADGELLFLDALITKVKGSRTEANRLDSLALIFLRKKPGNYFLGETLLEKGDFLDINDDKQLNEKIASLKEALPCFAGASYIRIRAGLWKSLGDLYGLRKENTKYVPLALDAYQRSLDAYFSYGYKNVQDIYIELADIYHTLGDDQQGLHYCLLALQTAERAKDSSGTMCEIYNNIAIQYMSRMDFPNAKKYFILAMALAEKLNDRSDIFSIASCLYYCYSHDKEYSKIKALVDKVHSRFPPTDLVNQYFSNIYYLRYYILTNDLINGRKYCLRLTKLADNASPPILRYYVAEVYNPIAEYYMIAGDFDNAYKYWNKAYATLIQYDNLPTSRTHLLTYIIKSTQQVTIWHQQYLIFRDIQH